MSEEKKKDIKEIVSVLEKLNSMGLILIKNSADTLLASDMLTEKNVSAPELVQQ